MVVVNGEWKKLLFEVYLFLLVLVMFYNQYVTQITFCLFQTLVLYLESWSDGEMNSVCILGYMAKGMLQQCLDRVPI